MFPKDITNIIDNYNETGIFVGYCGLFMTNIFIHLVLIMKHSI